MLIRYVYPIVEIGIGIDIHIDQRPTITHDRSKSVGADGDFLETKDGSSIRILI